MSMQSMEPQDEGEFHASYSQQKLHPRVRQFPSRKTLLVSFFVILWVAFAVGFVVAAVTSPSSTTGSVAGGLFLSLFFILALWGFVKAFLFDGNWPRKIK